MAAGGKRGGSENGGFEQLAPADLALERGRCFGRGLDPARAETERELAGPQRRLTHLLGAQSGAAAEQAHTSEPGQALAQRAGRGQEQHPKRSGQRAERQASAGPLARTNPKKTPQKRGSVRSRVTDQQVDATLTNAPDDTLKPSQSGLAPPACSLTRPDPSLRPSRAAPAESHSALRRFRSLALGEGLTKRSESKAAPAAGRGGAHGYECGDHGCDERQSSRHHSSLQSPVRRSGPRQVSSVAIGWRAEADRRSSFVRRSLSTRCCRLRRTCRCCRWRC